MGPKRVVLGARVELRVDEKTKRRIERVSKGFGKSVGDYVRGLCLAGVSRWEAEERAVRMLRKAKAAPGVAQGGRGGREKGV